MLRQNRFTFQFLLLFVVILVSRIPFLFAGYGVEEDSWGMINALRRVHDSGVFEISRFPGHPVLEFSYLAVWGCSYFVFNFLTALVSTIGFIFFAASLKLLGFRKFFWATLALAFTPIVYIKCTDTMDFMWGLSFMMVSLYFILRSRVPKENEIARLNFFTAGAALGLAIGARFTAALFFVPLLILFFDLTKKETLIQLLVFFFSMLVFAVVCFIPAIKHFDSAVYSVPYMFGRPEILKSLFKASIGVFGLIGCLFLFVILIKAFFYKIQNRNRVNKKYFIKAHPKLQTSKFLSFAFISLIIYVLLFIWQPHKSAYLIAALPFLIMLIEFYSNERYTMMMAVGMILSSFLLGINLDDNFRGASASPLSIKMKVASQKISIDFLKGPVLADNSRRYQKMNFANDVISKAASLNKPTVIIAGWWINEIEVLSAKIKNQNVNYFYFLNEEELKKYQQQNFSIFYLPQQEQVNDLRWQKNFTRNYAEPLYSDDGQKFLF